MKKSPAKPAAPQRSIVKPRSAAAAWARLAALVLVPVALISGVFWGWEYLWPSGSMQDKMKRLEARDLTPPPLNPSEPPGPAPEGMVWVPGGEFWMGTEEADDAVPLRKVYVDGFWMDKTEVTNEQWAKFVAATNYITYAEKKPDPKDFPNADPKALDHPFSLVFKKPRVQIANALLAQQEHLWWDIVEYANWRQPQGKGSDISSKEQYPVVHICWDDAVAYCKWAGKRLPTEAEWEFAARGGLDRKRYFWGDELRPGGKCQANIWDGDFPNENAKDDGYEGIAPVAQFPPNGYGLHDMAGNVWEWCADWYQSSYYLNGPTKNPQGPTAGFDPNEPGAPKRVQRGGSYLCAENYCTRYVAGRRGKGEVTSGSNHIGFRCVLDAAP